MVTTFPRVTRSGLLGLVLISCALQPAVAAASHAECGQPVSLTTGPSASDALAILREAVGLATACDTKPCVCDVDDSSSVSALDALLTLKAAVHQDVDLTCDCAPVEPACTSVEATIQPGSMLDLGWTGLGHDQHLGVGFKLQFEVVSRCSSDDSVCEQDEDCPSEGTCTRTCDCGDDTTCELAGPVGPKHCVTTLADCTSNADCSAGVACVDTFSPPQPLSSGGTPICIVPYFTQSLQGTADVGTGEVLLEGMNLRWRMTLGIDLAQPCPRCGQVGQQPTTCEGGQSPGKACTVDAVHPYFGGTSYDCPPSLSSIFGTGQAVRLQALTTGTTTRTAQLPCSDFSFQSHPSRGNGKCLDNNAACTSNADCTRCSEDPMTTCASNADCADKGTCAEAPDQPVTCGYWCHCGFCNNDPSLPCFQDGDCSDGKTCVVGTGGSTAGNAPQKKPNDCNSDKFICGFSDEEETCGNMQTGACSEQPYRNCQNDTVCQTNGAGSCVLEPRSCFEPRITRHGEPSPLAGHCAADGGPCSNNADCATIGDACLSRTMAPALEALSCMPGSSSGAVNSASGTTGPASLRLEQLLRWCSCGDGEPGCSEQCDDGNLDPGDGCDERCRVE